MCKCLKIVSDSSDVLFPQIEGFLKIETCKKLTCELLLSKTFMFNIICSENNTNTMKTLEECFEKEISKHFDREDGPNGSGNS